MHLPISGGNSRALIGAAQTGDRARHVIRTLRQECPEYLGGHTRAAARWLAASQDKLPLLAPIAFDSGQIKARARARQLAPGPCRTQMAPTGCRRRSRHPAQTREPRRRAGEPALPSLGGSRLWLAHRRNKRAARWRRQRQPLIHGPPECRHHCEQSECRVARVSRVSPVSLVSCMRAPVRPAPGAQRAKNVDFESVCVFSLRKCARARPLKERRAQFNYRSRAWRRRRHHQPVK